MGSLRKVGVVFLAAASVIPLPGCAQGANPIGAVAGLAMSIGASVGSYLLIKELS